MGRPLINIIGKRFGKLVVLHRVKDRYNGIKRIHSEAWYRVQCDCGKKTSMRGYLIRDGRARSCGCMHGFKHGLFHTPEYALWRSVKHQAARNGLDFNLDVFDIKIPEKCPLLGTPLRIGKPGWATGDNASVDRVDPRKGYVKGNVWVVSKRANSIKNDATPKELKLIARNLEKLWPSYT